MGEVIKECCGKPESQCTCDEGQRTDEKLVEKCLQEISKSGYKWLLNYDYEIKDALAKAIPIILKEIPFKKTTIGHERSMPDGTVIWFITDEERNILGGGDR